MENFSGPGRRSTDMENTVGAKKLHKRSDLHLARKGFHIAGGLMLLYPMIVLDKPTEWLAALLSTMLALVMTVEYLRSNFPQVNQIAVVFLGPFMRESELNRVTGIPFYLASCLFSVLVFPTHIAHLAILHLVFGDPFSSFFGVLLGRDKLFPNKSLQGTLGGFLVCALVTAIYLRWIGIHDERFLLLSLLGGFSGALAELLPVNIDDNFAIPVISGTFMLVAFWAAGLPLS